MHCWQPFLLPKIPWVTSAGVAVTVPDTKLNFAYILAYTELVEPHLFHVNERSHLTRITIIERLLYAPKFAGEDPDADVDHGNEAKRGGGQHESLDDIDM